jgi:hypothetical protein
VRLEQSERLGASTLSGEAPPAIEKIPDFGTLLECSRLNYLRETQVQASGTYWYLRLMEVVQDALDLQQYDTLPADPYDHLIGSARSPT